MAARSVPAYLLCGYYGENNLGQQLAIEILEKKVRRFLRENADIQDPS